MENSDKALNTGAKRVYDVAPSEIFADFMKNGWAPTPLTGITQDEVVSHCVRRRAELSAAFTGLRLVLPSGGSKQRSNDTDYLYRPHTAFAYYTGVQGVEANPDSVLVMDPADGGHTPILFINPRSTRDTSAFYTDAKNGELWVGRRFTTDEASQRYGIEVREIAELEKFLKGKKSAALHGFDEVVDSTVKEHPRDAELLEFVSVARLIKDEYEIAEMQKAVDATHRGFNDVIRALPAAVATPRGERVVEAAFFGRARIEGNDLGYNTIAASGSHACVLHWNRNDGAVRNGDLLLLDAGVEIDSYYTADITRTLPINGKFTPAEGKPLAKHVDGEPASGDFNYSSVVGMLLYLAGHTCPDITYAISCAARYMICPKLVHKQVLKRIGRYLKATADKGLIMKPSEKLLKIDSFPDADFAGMYGHKAMDDPVCVKSRT